MPGEPRRKQRAKIIAVVHLDKRAAPLDVEFVHSHVHSHVYELPWFPKIRSISPYLSCAPCHIWSRECMAYGCIRVCLRSEAAGNRGIASLEIARRIYFTGWKTRRVCETDGPQVWEKLEEPPSRVVSKLYSNLCREAIDLLRLGVGNSKSVKCKAHTKSARRKAEKFLNQDWKVNRNAYCNQSCVITS